MNNWRNYCNYRRKKNDDGTYSHFIVVDGKYIEVEESLYREYAVMTRKMKYMELDIKRNRTKQDPQTGRRELDENGQTVVLPERETSLDKLMEADWDFPNGEQATDEVVIALMESAALHDAIEQLDAGEQALIRALYFDDVSAAAFAKISKVDRSTIVRRRDKILLKLRELMSN